MILSLVWFMIVLTQRYSMCKFRLLLIIYIHFISNISGDEIEYCEKSWNVTCDCEANSDEGLNIYCPQKNNAKIEVLLTDEYIQLECDKAMTFDDYKAISTINLSAINRLTRRLYGEEFFHHEKFIFKNCVIPLNGFEDMIQKLTGTAKPNTLFFDECLPFETIDDDHVEFRSKHFNGFSEIVGLYVKSTGKQNVTLSTNTFDLLANIEHLKVTLPTLLDMNGELFRNQGKLKELTLEQTPVHITEELFTHLHSISKLHVIQSVQLHTLRSNAFELLPDIRELIIAYNNLTILPPELLHSNQHLQTLLIVEPELTSLPDDLLVNLKYLTDFTLSNTSIATIHVDFFKTTTELTSIDMSSNKLTSLPDGLFHDLSKLVRIDLGHNKLKQFPTSILFSLQYLYLNNNSLTTYPTFAHSSANFEMLDLSDNQIDGINSANLRFPQPSSIYLKNNLIATIDFSDITSTIYNNTIQTTLHLDGNPINCDDSLLDFIIYMENTDKLFVDGGECSAPSNLAKFPLSKIDVDVLMHQRTAFSSEFCSIGCDCSFQRADKMFVMNCTENGLEQLRRFPKAESLGYKDIALNFANQNVSRFPNLIQLPENGNVISVNASNNNIQYFSREMLSNNWISLDLSKNKIVSLAEDLIKSGEKLEKMWLSSNPLECDCRMQLIFLNTSKVVDYREITCANRAGKPLYTLDLCTDNNVFIIALCLTAVFVALLLTFYYKYREFIYAWLYATFGRSFGESFCEKPFDAFVSFAELDSDYVYNHLAPALESGPEHYRLCIHTRDWIAAPIIEQIYESVENSRYTIIVLSENFLLSSWGIAEFRAAQSQANDERRSNVIMVMYGNVNEDCIAIVPKEMQAYLRANTYLKSDDPWFLEKLRYSLRRTRRERRVKTNDMDMIEMSVQPIQ